MHISVLLKETISCMNLKEDSIVIDATLGLAGHSKEVLSVIKKGFLYGFEQDEEAIKIAKINLKNYKNYEIINKNFIYIAEEMLIRNIDKVDAILFDLGVSSLQLDSQDRGFSFHQDAKLDMRMNQNDALTAYDIVNQYKYEDLIRIFLNYGEEKYAKNIARSIEKNRIKKPITTTLELVEIIKSAVPEKYKRESHPARRIFQALRIEVNNELEVFEQALIKSLDLIKVGGRICVITFHSLEDKICKKIFKEVSEVRLDLKKMPLIPEQYLPNFKVITQIKPQNQEIFQNRRSRSAKLRVIERTK